MSKGRNWDKAHVRRPSGRVALGSFHAKPKTRTEIRAAEEEAERIHEQRQKEYWAEDFK